MNGFEWSDERGIEATGLFRTIRSLLSPANLPSRVPILRETIASQITAEIQSASRNNGSAHLSVLHFATKIILRCNAVMFFPEELGNYMVHFCIRYLIKSVNDPSFMEAALGFTTDVFLSAEIIKLLPSYIGSYVTVLVLG